MAPEDDRPPVEVIGRYEDDIVREDGAWRFATRDYSTLARTDSAGDGMDVFPVPGT